MSNDWRTVSRTSEMLPSLIGYGAACTWMPGKISLLRPWPARMTGWRWIEWVQPSAQSLLQ
ncbi:hypothetical protein OV079_50995 [Nannocystis pusilla]|uniref:Uncharacterized protein n=1 Tax=Nannocystis pusilla TaxID=889268 RepID=A0A9X3J3F5_9BACT|nr:hypothetical protein [Nannocystis pusilla]MCY1013721.1 hypothetical protein [Nannocystis pusilla]